MRIPNRSLAIVTVLAMVLLGCGDDDDDATTATDDVGSDTSAPLDTSDGGEQDTASALAVTVSTDGVELSADSVASGPVEITVTNETGASTDVDFTLVDDGTTVDEFAQGFAPVLAGGPFPDFAITNAGITAGDGSETTNTVVLEPGEYVVWALPEGPEGEGEGEGEGDEGEGGGEDSAAEGDDSSGAGEEEGPPPEAFLTTTLTVTGAEGDRAFPDTDGTITAKDYGFDVDVSGPGTYTFANSGPSQFHHAIVVDFGTNDAAAVEAGLPAFLASDGEAPPPEGIDPSQIDFEFASSGVFGPDGKGTFEADFEEGNTYAAICFIQDRTGSPPHAIAYDMYEVFQAG